MLPNVLKWRVCKVQVVQAICDHKVVETTPLKQNILDSTFSPILCSYKKYAHQARLFSDEAPDAPLRLLMTTATIPTMIAKRINLENMPAPELPDGSVNPSSVCSLCCPASFELPEEIASSSSPIVAGSADPVRPYE